MRRVFKLFLVAFCVCIVLNFIEMYWLQSGILLQKNYDRFTVVNKSLEVDLPSLFKSDVDDKTFGGKLIEVKIQDRIAAIKNQEQDQVQIQKFLDLFPKTPNKDFSFHVLRNKLNTFFQSNTRKKAFEKYEDRLIKQLEAKVKSRRNYTKSILVYFHDNNLSDKTFLESDCPVKNCRFMKKPEDFETADAVLFKEIPVNLKRPKGKQDQVWIYYQLEAPSHTRVIPEGVIVNWTATYRPDSIIHTPYGYFHAKKQKLKKKNRTATRFNFAKSKKKLVAWFVSNCRDDNGRMNFVKELQKYIQVDIYGDCGPLKCNHYGNNNKDGTDSCDEMLKKDYKFYLAFENTNCKAYITEKFFKCFRHDVVPIVMGAPLEDYVSIAPAHSFIHVDQFKTPRDLARYLYLLNTHHSMYNRYFQWKSTHKLINTKFMCRLCLMLESAPYFQMEYFDINKWWSNGQCMSQMEGNRHNWTTWI